MKRKIIDILYICIIWAVIYTPFIGKEELKRNEVRRAQVSKEMLNSGDYLVPRLNGKLYLKKPPIANWAILYSYKLFGNQSELTTRISSIVLTLLTTIGIYLLMSLKRERFNPLLVSLLYVTYFPLVDGSRFINTDVFIISFTALASCIWFVFHDKSMMKSWLFSAPFIGLGLLSKGPLVFFFFYIFILAVLCYEGKAKKLLNPWHFAGLLIGVGIFFAWAAQLSHVVPPDNISHGWLTEIKSHFDNFISKRHFSKIIFTILQYLLYIVPIVMLGRNDSLQDKRFSKFIFGGFMIGLGIVMMLPDLKPRYTLPFLFMLVLVASRKLDGFKSFDKYINYNITKKCFLVIYLIALSISLIKLDYAVLCVVCPFSLVAVLLWIYYRDMDNFKGLNMIFCYIAAIIFLFYSIKSSFIKFHHKKFAHEIVSKVSEDSKIYSFYNEEAFSFYIPNLFFSKPANKLSKGEYFLINEKDTRVKQLSNNFACAGKFNLKKHVYILFVKK